MRIFILLFTWIGAMCIPVMLLAQDDKPQLSPVISHAAAPKKDTVLARDLYEVISTLFGGKAGISADTIGTKPVFSVVPALGYTLQSKLALTLAGNVAFRVTPTTRISTITINSAITQTRQLILPLQSNIWTKNNLYDLVGDIRFLRYPQSTYGLGSSSKIRNDEPMNYDFFRFGETVLRRVSDNFYAGAGYILDVHWRIKDRHPFDRAPSAYQAYGGGRNSLSSGVTLNTLYDSRDNSINPYRGFYAAFQYRDNGTYLGNVKSWQVITIDVRKYINFPAGSDNVLALWSYNWLILSGHAPYLDLPANTWDTYSGTGRGYIQGRFRGAQMVYGEGEYRFKVSADGLFGGVVFVNAESFSAAEGTRLQAVQPAFGPGLRIKLNKVSRTNIAIDYGIGLQGSRGVFINVGEIF